MYPETTPDYSIEKESECYLPAHLRMVHTKYLEVLNRIVKEMTGIRAQLKSAKDQHIHREWLHIAYVLDTLLFRVYLALLIVYTVSVVCLWSR